MKLRQFRSLIDTQCKVSKAIVDALPITKADDLRRSNPDRIKCLL